MKKIVNKIEREVGGKVYEGVCEILETEEGKQYIYKYPEAAKIGEKLNVGDRQRLREITGYTPQYINMVLNGERWNNRVIEVALRIIELVEEVEKLKN